MRAVVKKVKMKLFFSPLSYRRRFQLFFLQNHPALMVGGGILVEIVVGEVTFWYIVIFFQGNGFSKNHGDRPPIFR